jgi:hydrogenase maturation protease
LIIGVGNEYRGDDGVGPAVAHALDNGTLPAEVEVIVQSGEATALMTAWADATDVILIDAVAAQDSPGKIYRIEAHAKPIPEHFLSCSTHDFGVAAAIELARAVGQLPPRVIVYGVEGEDFSMGAQLSPMVAGTVGEVVVSIMADIRTEAAPAR